MYLGSLLKSIDNKYKRISVRGISFNSKKIKKGDVFFAIKGNKETGAKFINEAIHKGASAIITNKSEKIKPCKTDIIKVSNVRKSLSEASSNFYKKKPKFIIAVTGTNGKSSVADFFYQILILNKLSVASIGTLGIISKNYKKKTTLTTSDPLLLHQSLKILKKKNINHVILEASSHGLHQNRLDNINIKVGIFTNLSHDHLDYHKNVKSYFNSKMYLFKKLLKKKSLLITDEDNKEFKKINKIAKIRGLNKITIGTKSGDLRLLEHSYKENGQLIKISYKSKKYILKIPLIGSYQIKNLLMAIIAALNCGINEKKIFHQIKKIKPVPGRLECVAELENNSSIIIDFAHTPEALEKSLIALKKQFKKNILIVFGCGGERDKAKRSKMGKIASRYCRKVFVTDDNPRKENPKKIRYEIIKGCKKVVENIGNRRKAIHKAIKELKPNELLLVAGKGHEKIQVYGKKIISFSDKEVIKEIVKKENKPIKKNKNKKEINDLIDLRYNKVSINSKTIQKKDIFFAIKGKKIDGHSFAREALKKGAMKLIVNKKIKKIPNKKTIIVKNTLTSLHDLSKQIRNNTKAKIIGITGSAGKTTLKNLVSFALKTYGKVHYSPLSYNNKFGVPISVSNLKDDTEYGVFELGMDKKGEINNLSKIVKPEIGVITNISGAHFKNFRTLKDIAKAKSEIIDNIVDGGSIILNRDDYFFDFLSHKAKKRSIKVFSFSLKKNANVRFLESKKISNFYRIKFNLKNKNFYLKTRYSGKSFLYNLMACISVLNILGLNLNKMQSNFIKFKLPEGRGDIKLIKKFNKKFILMDESYNANPLSMLSAINNLNNYSSKNIKRKIAILGDMLELGKKAKKFHKNLSKIINVSDVDKVYVCGKLIRDTYINLSNKKKGKIFDNLKVLNNNLAKIIHNKDLLMIKGSNATGLNAFAKNIKRRYLSAI